MAVRRPHRDGGRGDRKVLVLLQVAWGIALVSPLFFGPARARADYYTPSYNRYGSYGYSGYFGGFHQQSPVISIDMDPRHQLDSSFRVAAREGRIEDMLGAVREGADVNSTSTEGDTALMYASRNCSVQVAYELLRLRANANIRNKQGDTALIYASMESCLPVVRLLLRTPQLDVRAKDREGKTALDYAQEGAVIEVDGPEAQIARLLKERLPPQKVARRASGWRKRKQLTQ